MRMAINNVVGREFIHWMWLWMLAAIAISVLQQTATGRTLVQDQEVTRRTLVQDQEVTRRTLVQDQEVTRRTSVQDQAIQVRGNVDLVGVPNRIVESDNVSLHDVLLLNQRRDYTAVIAVWQQLDVERDSSPWKHIGIGVAHLRLDNVDQAQELFERAIDIDPENAVAEYFLGRVCQARSRRIPFWYEQDNGSSVRLIAFPPRDDDQRLDRGEAFLPHFKTLPFEKQARQHFRRAIHLSGVCGLDRTIEIVEPRVRLIGYDESKRNSITIRDLLISLDEEDYVERARSEVAERFVGE